MIRSAALVALAATAAAASFGASAQTFIDHARVRSVEPQYQEVRVPREECSSHWVTQPRQASAAGLPGVVTEYGPAVVGGVAGAALGHQVGKGSGRDAATALGAIVGALAADRYTQGSRGVQPVYEQREVRECRTVYDVQNQLTGYRVNYDYHGQSQTTVMREQPGRQLQVRVSVEPVTQ